MKSQNMNRACALVVMASFQPITRGKSGDEVIMSSSRKQNYRAVRDAKLI